MTAFDIFSAVGNADDTFLEETEHIVSLNTYLFRIAAVAAAIAAVTVGIAFTVSMNDAKNISINETSASVSEITSDTVTVTSYDTSVSEYSEKVAETSLTSETEIASITDSNTASEHIEKDTESITFVTSETIAAQTSEKNTPEGTFVPAWEDIAEDEQYTYLIYNGHYYNLTSNRRYSADEVEFICNGEIIGYDEYTGEEHKKSCEFYRVNGISEKFCIAVRNSEGSYRGYVCDSYDTTLRQFAEESGIFRNGGFTDAVHYNYSENKNIVYHLEDLNEKFQKLVNSAHDAECIVNPIDYDWDYYGLRIDENIVVYVYYKSGHIRIYQQFFYVGEENTMTFAEYIESHADTSEIIQYTTAPLSDEVIPE